MQAKAPLLATLFVLLFTTPAVTAELTVQVVNQTANAPPPPALTVLLSTYVNGQKVEEQEAQTDSQQRAVFRSLTVREGGSYAAQVNYRGVKYESGPIQLTSVSRNVTVELPIYEPTVSPDAIQVQMQHTIVRPLRGALGVQEMYLIENPTDRTYVGNGEVKPGARRVVEFTLPAGFTDIQFGQGLMPCCIVGQETGFVDTMEIKPGQRVAQFKYLLPSTQPRITFQPNFLAPTRQYSLLVSPDLRVTRVSGLEPMGNFNTGRELYLLYTASNLAPGIATSVELSDLPVDRTLSLRWLALTVAAGLALMVAAGVLRSRRPQAKEVSQTPPAPERRRILEEIVRLDEAYEAGNLASAEYQRLRDSKKAALARLYDRTDRPA